jgi:hypothetical protein
MRQAGLQVKTFSFWASADGIFVHRFLWKILWTKGTHAFLTAASRIFTAFRTAGSGGNFSRIAPIFGVDFYHSLVRIACVDGRKGWQPNGG